jgi:DNA invertase Pin-like site-specific DNA recombinase
MKEKSQRQHAAVIYMRVGSPHPEDAAHVVHQREGCEYIAAKYGLTVIREYIDLGQPARWERQTELQRLVRDLSTDRDAAFVIVWDFSRLAHSLAQLDERIIRIHACGAEIATLTGVEAAIRYVQQQEDQQSKGGNHQ